MKDDGSRNDSLKGIPLQRSAGLLLVMDTPKGRGVFAGKDIPARTILEVCPVLVLDPTENENHIRQTDLYNYTYNWPYTPPEMTEAHRPDTIVSSTTQAIILGLGSMFNHSNLYQNVGWHRDIQNQLVTYMALRDIKSGEELCISYGSRLTFKDSDVRPPSDTYEDAAEMLARIELLD